MADNRPAAPVAVAVAFGSGGVVVVGFAAAVLLFAAGEASADASADVADGVSSMVEVRAWIRG